MAEVRPRVMLAGVTITGGIEGTRISAILCVFDHHPPCRGKQKAVTRVTRREDAVEHVDPSAHALEQVLWFTNPHEIARLVHRQLGSSMCHEIVHDVPWFTDAQTAYGIAVEAALDQFLYTPISQLFISAALDNTKESPNTIPPSLLAPPGPATGHLHRQACGPS